MRKIKGDEVRDRVKVRGMSKCFPFYLLQLSCPLRTSSSISGKASGPVAGSAESAQTQIFPCSLLHLLSNSTVAPKVHSPRLIARV